MLGHNFHFSRSGEKLDLADIRAAETQIGCKLPDAFRALLLDQNGGTADPSLISKYMTYDFAIWLDLAGVISTFNMLANAIPDEKFVPFAFDRSATFLCFRCSGKSYGSSVWSVYDWPVHIEFVVGSFEEFLRSLVQKAPCPVRELYELSTSELLSRINVNEGVINSIDENGMSLIRHTIRQGNLESFELLLEHGASLSNCLETAVLYNRPQFVQRLLEYGMDPAEGRGCIDKRTKSEIRSLLSE